MKTLIWKEWREQRLLLLTGVLLLIIFSVILPVIFKTYDTFSITAFIVVIIAGMIGADSFSREKNTLEFLLSNPLKKETVFYAKLLSGILNILTLIFLALALNIMIYETYGFGLIPSVIGHSVPPGVSRMDYILSSLPIYGMCFSVYIITFFTSVLFLNTLIAFFAAPVIIFPIGLVFYFINSQFSNIEFTTLITKIYGYSSPIIFLYLAYLTFKRREAKQ